MSVDVGFRDVFMQALVQLILAFCNKLLCRIISFNAFNLTYNIAMGFRGMGVINEKGRHEIV